MNSLTFLNFERNSQVFAFSTHQSNRKDSVTMTKFYKFKLSYKKHLIDIWYLKPQSHDPPPHPGLWMGFSVVSLGAWTDPIMDLFINFRNKYIYKHQVKNSAHYITYWSQNIGGKCLSSTLLYSEVFLVTSLHRRIVFWRQFETVSFGGFDPLEISHVGHDIPVQN